MFTHDSRHGTQVLEREHEHRVRTRPTHPVLTSAKGKVWIFRNAAFQKSRTHNISDYPTFHQSIHIAGRCPIQSFSAKMDGIDRVDGFIAHSHHKRTLIDDDRRKAEAIGDFSTMEAEAARTRTQKTFAVWTEAWRDYTRLFVLFGTGPTLQDILHDLTSLLDGDKMLVFLQLFYSHAQARKWLANLQSPCERTTTSRRSPDAT